MKIGCPKEVKNGENRAGLTPSAASAYIAAGHDVFIERGAGMGSSIADSEYTAIGAKLLPTAEEVWNTADMIVKVKEPVESEYPLMRQDQLVYTYFHFAADENLVRVCMKQKIIALAYETVQEGRTLPLLKPMSEVAGRMSSLIGAFYLAKTQGGRGVLPMGATGVAPAEILVLGGGVVGANAAHVAAGLNANVTILDVNLSRLEYLDEIMPANVVPLYNDPVTFEDMIKTADVVIGAVLIPGAKAPKLLRREHLKTMKPGSVIVDVAIDQGGCFETSRATTHSDPIYVIDDVIHYCVANMPGAYARTATFALNSATIGYGLQLANKNVEQACRDNAALRLGLNMYKGAITYRSVADAFNMQDKYIPAETVVG
ncbi:MAG: alanine dehydrogenase [Planctomycetota bacterium]|jgi:alanine dehydrogenase|nr:alanine dehydrogenase [Planctomycetota bacterium]